MILLMDGFDMYASTDHAKRGWSQAFASMGSGRFGEGQSANASSLTTRALKVPSSDGIFVQGGYKSNGSTTPVTVYQGVEGGSPQYTLVWDPTDSTFKIYSGGPTGILLGASSTVTLIDGQWNHYELYVLLSATNGTVTLKRNGGVILGLTGVVTLATSNLWIDRIGLGGGSLPDGWDDLVVFDDTGSVNNAFMGDYRILTKFPTSDGAHLNFTPSSGSVHYSLVDEPTPNSTDQVSASATNDADSYGFEDLPTGTSIAAIQINPCVSKDDPATRNVATLIRRSSTDYLGDTQVSSTTEEYLSQIVEIDPSTSSPFTPTNFNASEFGLKVVA